MLREMQFLRLFLEESSNRPPSDVGEGCVKHALAADTDSWQPPRRGHGLARPRHARTHEGDSGLHHTLRGWETLSNRRCGLRAVPA
eukprot:6196162-Pleurochrysis_carterae.AAC.1